MLKLTKQQCKQLTKRATQGQPCLVSYNFILVVGPTRVELVTVSLTYYSSISLASSRCCSLDCIFALGINQWGAVRAVSEAPI